MISEGIHSTVDTANQLLILYGLKRSKKAPDQSHPFGYEKELYFWSFVVSILIFGLGGALSIYQGLMHIREPEFMKDPFWNYIVLILSLIFEGTSFSSGGTIDCHDPHVAKPFPADSRIGWISFCNCWGAVGFCFVYSRQGKSELAVYLSVS